MHRSACAGPSCFTVVADVGDRLRMDFDVVPQEDAGAHSDLNKKQQKQQQQQIVVKKIAPQPQSTRNHFQTIKENSIVAKEL